jgi:hypothetical protein
MVQWRKTTGLESWVAIGEGNGNNDLYPSGKSLMAMNRESPPVPKWMPAVRSCLHYL